MHVDREVRLEATNDALLVANGGRAFSRRGVISICASHLSDKRLSQSDDDVQDDFGGADADLVQGIRDRELETYSRDRNRITSDYRGEDETSRDYGDRFLWELLQNAADAMGDDRPSGELIGSKGLGFKAVLEVTETPEIHSGPFHFLFSAAKTQRLLKKEGLHDDPPPLTFRIPHTATPDGRVKELLDAGYTTVIRLPWKDDDARRTVLRRLQDLDHLFMLLVPQLSTLRITGSNGETLHRTHGSELGLSDGVVRLTTDDSDGSQSTCWRRWTWTQKQNGKHLTAAICLPLAKGDKGVPIAHCRTTPLFAFFPTQHETKMRAVVHASFDLEHSRKSTRTGDHDDEIIEAFENLLCRVIDDVPAQTALEAFAQTGPDDEDANLSSASPLPGDRLRPTAWRTVSKTRFIPTVGGGSTRPGAVRLWRHRLGFVLNEDVDDVRNARLLAPGLRRLSSQLRRFGAEELRTAQYINLLRHCRNRSASECVLSWMTLTRVLRQAGYPMAERLQVPCWWTESEVARPLDGGLPMLLDRPESWPDWLQIDILHSDMKAAGTRGSKPPWESTDVLRTQEHYCDRVLYPHLATWTQDEWCDRGWVALDQFRQWYTVPKKDVAPWVGRSTQYRRKSAIAHLRVPTDKGWLPSADCYAGGAWDGLKAFDRYFASIRDRGLLLPWEQWPKQMRQETAKDDWKPILRWLGVSWEPKVREMELSSDEKPRPNLWRAYKDDNDIWATSWIFNVIIEHFPHCIRDLDVAEPEHTMDAVIRLARAVASQNARYFYRKPKTCTTFAWYQLRNTKWLPCTRSLLHNEDRVVPTQAFMPDMGFNGMLPEVLLRGSDREIWIWLWQLGVKSGLPDYPGAWHDWMCRLSRIGNGSDRYDPEHVRRAADALYRGYLNLESGDDTPFPSDIQLPCLTAADDGPVFTFASASEVYYVDEPHLQEVGDEIVQRGYNLFILSPHAGKRAPSRLRISRLSSALNADVRFIEEDVRATEAVRLRYQQRRVGLILAAGLKEGQLPQDLAVSVVKDLRVDLVDPEKVEEIASVGVLSWTGQDRPLLLSQRSRWRAFGHGLARWVVRRETMASLFETLLRERSRREYEDRLLQFGITRDDVERAMADWTDDSDSDRGDSRERWEGSGPDDSTGDLDGREHSEPDTTDSVDAGRSGGHEFRQTGSGVRQTGSEGGGAGKSGRPPTGGSGPGSTGPSGKQPNVAAGRAAEDWLAERLEETFPQGAVQRRVRDSQNRESDFVVRPGSVEFHIEVKHLARVPGKVYWSEGQCGKAQEIFRGESAEWYFMALLVSDSGGQYQIYWSWNPLSELQLAQREVQWEGTSKYEAVESDSWDVADQQPEDVPVNRHKFRIQVDQGLLDGLDEDDGRLRKLREQIDEVVATSR